jgi:predicted TIM-barrel fold metal-dependent hydrolase
MGRCIALEEAFCVPELAEAYLALPDAVVAADRDVRQMQMMLRHVPPIRDRLLDLGSGRLEMMDAAGVDVAVLSLVAPGVQSFEAEQGAELARVSNDRLAEAVAAHPTRFEGFAAFAPQDPVTAAEEIERAVGELGMRGALVNSHTHGVYLDDPSAAPIFEVLTSLDVPLYIHPRNPPEAMVRFLESAGPASPDAHPGVLHAGGGPRITEAFWGFHMETSLHVARMIVSGVFERHPRLKVVLGHLGEGIPAVLERMDWAARLGFGLARPPSETFVRHVWLTTSGLLDHRLGHLGLRFAVDVMGPDRVLFAADHPFGQMGPTLSAVRNAGLEPSVLDDVLHGNAERLLGLAGGDA